jgi:hypothetical protein
LVAEQRRTCHLKTIEELVRITTFFRLNNILFMKNMKLPLAILDNYIKKNKMKR